MRTRKKKTLFEHYRKSLDVAGIATTRGDSLICPLCWQETAYDDLTQEHMVPGSLGGSPGILTCERCNNEHGSHLDAHLAQYQTVADALRGHGTIPAKLNVNGQDVVANLQWGADKKNFLIVGKASNPAACDAIKEDFKAGNVSEVNFTLDFQYAESNFQTAVLRAAYLVVFKCFGYEYARDEVVQVIRRRICDRSLKHPRIGSLIFEMRNRNMPYDEAHLVAPAKLNDTELFLVTIRIRKATTTYWGACLPVSTQHSDGFFDLMEQYSREQKGHGVKITIPHKAVFT